MLPENICYIIEENIELIENKFWDKFFIEWIKQSEEHKTLDPQWQYHSTRFSDNEVLEEFYEVIKQAGLSDNPEKETFSARKEAMRQHVYDQTLRTVQKCSSGEELYYKAVYIRLKCLLGMSDAQLRSLWVDAAKKLGLKEVARNIKNRFIVP